MNHHETHDDANVSEASEHSDTVVHQIFKAIVVLTLVSAPFVIYFTPGLHVMHGLWIAFLLVNLLVWGVVLIAACGQSIVRGVMVGRLMLMRRQRSRRERVGAAGLALE